MAKKITIGTRILNTLAAAGGTMLNTDFTKNERAALRRLDKKGLVGRDGADWRLTGEGAEVADDSGDKLGPVVTAHGLAAVIKDEEIAKEDTVKCACGDVVQAGGGSVCADCTKETKKSRKAAIAKAAQNKMFFDEHGTPAEKAKANAKVIKLPAPKAPKAAKKAKAAKPVGGWPVSVKTQVCSKDGCSHGGAEQGAGEFYRDRSRKTGLDCWCKTCTKAHYAAKREASKLAAAS